MAQTGHHEKLARDDVKPPTEKSFGLTFTVVFSLIGLWFLWRRGQPVWAAILLATAAGFLTVALASPQKLRPFNLAWLKVGLVLHHIVNPVVMGLLFYLVFTPTGVVMRLLGKDLLRLKQRPGAESYWIKRAANIDTPSSMKQQF